MHACRSTLEDPTTDIVGNKGSGQMTRPLRVLRDRTAPRLHRLKLTQRRGDTRIVATVSDGESTVLTVTVTKGRRLLARTHTTGNARFMVDRRRAQLKGALLTVTDESGNRISVTL